MPDLGLEKVNLWLPEQASTGAAVSGTEAGKNNFWPSGSPLRKQIRPGRGIGLATAEQTGS